MFYGRSPNENVLVIGIGDGGVVKELTRYDQIQSIDLVEMDEMVAELVDNIFLRMPVA